MKINKISFIGLGKLGLPLATTLAKNNNKILAIDKNEELITKLKNGETPWVETLLEENLNLAKKNIQYTTKYDGIIETDATIILVNTPSNKKDGSFSNLYVEQTILEISKVLKKHNKKNHLFILSSTVMPTSINNSLIPLIENLTGWKINDDFGFCYVPDFVAIGQVINDFENPDFLLIGESNEIYGNMVNDIYSTIIKNDCKIIKNNLIEAEICKISLNAYITTKISFANYLGLLCEKIDPNINVNNITDTIGNDLRIGKKYFKSGGSYGGTCFPRDTWAFMKLSSNFGLKSFHMEANETINDMVIESILSKILTSNKKNIGLIGLGFKPNTSVVTEGLAHKIMNTINNKHYNFFVYDVFNETYNNLKKETNVDFNCCENLDKLIINSDILIICNNDDRYILNKNTNKIIIDPWKIIKN
jgi:UDPglucose 6-dehydrogenase